MNVQPNCGRSPHHFGIINTMGQALPTVAAVQWSQPEPRRQAVCAAENRAREVTQAPGGVQIMSESWALKYCTVGVGIYFDLIVTVPSFFLLEIRFMYLFMYSFMYLLCIHLCISLFYIIGA